MPYQYIPHLIFRIVNFGLEQFFTSINYAPFRVTLVQVLRQPGKGSRFSPAGISREPSAAKTQVLSMALWQKVIRHRLFD